MIPTPRLPLAVVLSTLALAACAQTAPTATPAPGQYAVGFGPSPQLPAPEKSLIPTVHIAKAQGWTNGAKPTVAAGLAVTPYATGLDHPRWLYVLPNGDVLVAESNKPANEKDPVSIKGAVQKQVMKKAGAGVASPDRIMLLRGVLPNGMAVTKTVFMENIRSPFGMVLVGKDLYVAGSDALYKFPYKEGDTKITDKGVKVWDLPAGINHHWTKNVVASADGKKLYVTVGSNSNVGENGMDIEAGRAAIWEFDPATAKGRIFASGLRNPNGMAWNPESKALWTAVNERDELGNDLVPDYITSVKDGAFYGWPYSYYGQNVDKRIEPARPDLVAKAIAPDYALGAHTASLGLAFYTGALLPQFKNGALVGQHGSWNRKPYSGYKLIYVPFSGGKPSGPPQDILTGFVKDEVAFGRPVGVAVDKAGAILLADDVGNVVWRVTPAGAAATPAVAAK
ncbi:PQQ-dependent sugar dehydrogenase [Massilia sp. S19_KUP03_FR1]|uniref:PQQ-dependent sugar dehydrogenase n=1 Tax=Massilia sp. S19_KUP03_FR1 TaxID=3025503 RepID=UPI002FCDC521